MSHCVPLNVGRIAIVGAGAVGSSWAALFAAHGCQVCIFDAAPDARAFAVDFIERSRRQLAALGLSGHGQVIFTDTLAAAVSGAVWIQESVTESEAIKAAVLAEIDLLAVPDALIGSSTSALLWSEITALCRQPQRVVIAHPFNPPHLIPLVEVYGPSDAAARAAGFMKLLGKYPIIMQRELRGHIANRLASALYREAVSLVEQGAATVADVDAAVCQGPGLRWAVMGPHLLYHLGGGQGGIRHYLAQLGPSQQRRWADLGAPVLNAALHESIIAGIEAEADGRSITDLEEVRDERLLQILALRTQIK